MSRFFDEAEKRHEAQLNALINEYEGNGDSENAACVKAKNALLPVLQKRAKKRTLREFTVDACNEKRSLLQKRDGNTKRTQRFRRI